jgi:hypothetical protein
VEEALYESLSMRWFAGIDLGREPVPDETTVCKCRRLLEQHDLGRAVFEQVHIHLGAHGVRISTDTIVDATILNAPSSTRNASATLDPNMHQTRKGQHWYFGMKAHIDIDSKTKVIYVVGRDQRSPPCFPACRMARKPGCGAIRLTRASPHVPETRPKRSRLHRSPVPFSIRLRRRAAGPNPRSGPRSSVIAG